MSAANVARALGDAGKEGRGWRCRCPLHGGRSLVLSDGEGGRLLSWCFGGCDGREVLAELRHRGLLDRALQDYPPAGAFTRRRGGTDVASRTARALAIWQEARPPAGTVAEKYLESRGVGLADLPAGVLASLRFHSRCPHPSGARLPAMIALVEHAERGSVAIHRTFLRPDGAHKACVYPNKAGLGPVGGGAVRFGQVMPGQWLVVAEGIETTLSVMRACALPGWAALSAGGMRTLTLPPEATMVLLSADNDANGIGQRSANVVAERFLAERRRVRIAIPREVGADFNDILRGTVLARSPESTDAAA